MFRKLKLASEKLLQTLRDFINKNTYKSFHRG